MLQFLKKWPTKAAKGLVILCTPAELKAAATQKHLRTLVRIRCGGIHRVIVVVEANHLALLALQNVRVYDKEFVVGGVMKQELDWDANVLWDPASADGDAAAGAGAGKAAKKPRRRSRR